MQLCFFEDQLLGHFHPLTLTRPIDDLRLGIGTIADKWNAALNPNNTARILRSELQGVFDQGEIDNSESCVWVNSRFLPTKTLIERIHDLETGSCLKNDATIIAAKTDGATGSEWLAEGKPNFNTLLVVETNEFTGLTHLWDLFLRNGDEIEADIDRFGIKSSNTAEASISPNAVLQHEDNIFIEEGATIEPGAILIAEDGPIYIGPGATVSAGAILKGPVAICEKAIVKMSARIYDATTIGPVCKAAGEISHSIFHSYSNKAHDGYVGNSLIGQWCNLGADTNTSNLKNNYSTIRITDWTSRQETETGQQFIGTIMGDHSKTAINVQLNTGTVCGVSCNIFTSEFPPKFIPSFTWVGTNVMQPYKFDKAAETMEAVMKRRDVEMSDAYKAMMQKLSKKSRA